MRKSKYEMRDWLEKRGYKPLGSGVYSIVYAHPKNKDIAVKVGSNDKWPDYIAWATKKGYAGTFAPKVYSLKHYGDFYIATMERLAGTFNEMLHREMLHYALPAHLEDIKTVLYYPEYHGKIKKGPRKGEYSNRAKFGTLAAFARDLYEAHFNHDMHNGNVMLRKDGHPVITDPAASGQSSKPRIKRGTITNYAN